MKKANKSKKRAARKSASKPPLSSLTEGQFNSVLDRALNKNENTGYSRVELNLEVNRRQHS